MKRRNRGIYSNLIAGVIAAVIFLVIALATGWTAGRALLGALILGLGTFVVAFLITQAITFVVERRSRG